MNMLLKALLMTTVLATSACVSTPQIMHHSGGGGGGGGNNAGSGQAASPAGESLPESQASAGASRPGETQSGTTGTTDTGANTGIGAISG